MSIPFRIYDSLRNHTYNVVASSVDDAIQQVQNDQWSEALDPVGVTPREQLAEAPKEEIVPT
jgi:hypothetical protein